MQARVRPEETLYLTHLNNGCGSSGIHTSTTSTPSSSSSAVALMCDEHPVGRSDEIKPSQDSSQGDKPLKHAYHQCTTNLNDR
ncbi:hypothetical protein ACLKA6_010936 [Drosophila palustris]